MQAECASSVLKQPQDDTADGAEGVHALLQLAVAQWEADKAAEAAPLLMRGLTIIQEHQQQTRGGRTAAASSRPILVKPYVPTACPASIIDAIPEPILGSCLLLQ